MKDRRKEKNANGPTPAEMAAINRFEDAGRALVRRMLNTRHRLNAEERELIDAVAQLDLVGQTLA